VRLFAHLRPALHLARCELRGGLRGFGVFLACLFLGVFALSAVGSLASSARRGLAADARALHGGDLEVALVHRELPAPARQYIEARGELSAVTRILGMARPAAGGKAELAEVKGVDAAYPLYGEVRLQPAVPLAQALAQRQGRHGAVADAALLQRLGLQPGDRLLLGEGEFEVRAILAAEPDRTFSALSLGPRLLVSQAGLAETGLLAPGSLVRHDYRIRLPAGDEPQPFIADLQARFPDAGWRVRGYTEAAPQVRRFLDRMDTSLTLVGLVALLVGGLGIAGAVRGYLAGKVRHIAAMKSLGAESRLIFTAYLLQILFLGALGALLGLAAGAALPFLIASLAGEWLPLPLQPAIDGQVLALAALFGLLVALLFSLPALGAARRVAPAVLFRGAAGLPTHPGRTIAFAVAALTLLLALLAVATSGDRRLALWFVAGATVCFLLFRLLAAALVRAAGRLPPPRRPAPRLALDNLRRPGGPGSRAVFSLGLGLTALVLIVQVQSGLDGLVAENMPRQAPSFFFFDIQQAQGADFDRVLAAIPAVSKVERRPTLRGRITAIDGVPVEKAAIDSEVEWAVRGDRYLTYAAQAPDAMKIVAGAWWPKDYGGAPQVSLSADLAEGFGVEIGDSLTVNVLGREITAQIANVREVDWSTLQLDFALIFSPEPLRNAPHTWIATVSAPQAQEEAVFAAVTERFGNVSVLRLREVLANLTGFLDRIGAAFRLMGGIALLAGLLVLAGALSADQHRRLYDAVVFKVCGATRRDVLGAFAAEFLFAGLTAGAIAAVVGTLLAWGVLGGFMQVDFVFRPAIPIFTVLAGAAVTLVLGLAGTARVLGKRPAPYLRNE